MTIFSDTGAGSNGSSAFNGVSGWNKYGSGVDAYQRNGSSQFKSIAANFPSDQALWGQDHGSADHFAEIQLVSSNWSHVNPGNGLAVRAVDRNEFIGIGHDGTDWGIYANGHGGRLGTYTAALAGTEKLRLQADSGGAYRSGLISDLSGGVTVTGAVTLPALTTAGAALQRSLVSGAVTLPSLTASAAAIERLLAAGAVTLPSLTASAAARQRLGAAAAIVLPSLTASGVANQAGAGISAAGDITLPRLTASSAAIERLLCQGQIGLPSLTAQSTAIFRLSAVGAITLPSLSVSGGVAPAAPGLEPGDFTGDASEPRQYLGGSRSRASLTGGNSASRVYTGASG